MKQVVIGWLWAALLLVSVGAWAQQPAAPATAPAAPRTQPGKLSTDPAQYIVDVQAMMASTKNPAAIASAAALQTLWASNKLTASQQRLIVDISQRLLAKRFKPRPHFETFFNVILAGSTKQNLSDQQMDGLLSTISTTLDREQVRDTERFMTMAAQFLQSNRLYYSRYNRVQLVRGTFSFAYNQSDQSLEPAAAPEPTPTASEPVRTGAPIKTTKPAAKPAKKKSSDGWDTVSDWGTNDGWSSSSNDGWSTSAKKACARQNDLENCRHQSRGSPGKRARTRADDGCPRIL
ncbi:hypothetical protein LRS06_07670 [Hymenobacter sp. J193]|uniref:hypothetical protein n=1 Tax=Hymenobacter sp. J193 TaxID=2898429 RepID=UPI0021514062|nr:hypothetical protein [Hymenobacter sp. J193]MCR5887657.1 hypothetical protein [Hymenobacter sp. J193]